MVCFERLNSDIHSKRPKHTDETGRDLRLEHLLTKAPGLCPGPLFAIAHEVAVALLRKWKVAALKAPLFSKNGNALAGSKR